MAYTDATATDLKAAFPRFDAVDDTTVDFWLGRAQRSVDESWTEGDFAMGQMLLACHLMTLEGLGTGAEAELAAAGIGDFKVIKSGALQLERGSSGGDAPAPGTIKSTSYGRRWAELAGVNVGGPRVSGSGVLPVASLFPGG